VNRIAVLGAGNGGCTFSGHLALKGYEVALFEFPSFEKNIEEIKKRGGVELTGAIEGFGQVSDITTDIEVALRGSSIVMVVVPAFAHRAAIETALPFIEDGQIWVFNPGNFGSLIFREILRKEKVNKKIKVADTASLMYATGKTGPTTVRVDAIKDVMPIAALPSRDIGLVFDVMKDVFEEFSPAANVLEIGFMNINMILHCAACILNLGRIEDTKGNFMFYWEGMTESVCKVMEKMDEERIKVGEALGLKLKPTLFSLRQFYPLERTGTDLHDWVTHSRAHGGQGPDAPNSAKHRYVSEDVPNGLVPVSLLGKLVGVTTTAIDSIISLSSLVNGIDYFNEGRSLEKMGLSGLTPQKIMSYLEKGSQKTGKENLSFF